MYIERKADRYDRTSGWLVCADTGKVLEFCYGRGQAETKLRAAGLPVRYADPAYTEQGGSGGSD